MPINFASHDYSNVKMNWSTIFDQLNELDFFKNKSVQQTFLSQWKKRIIESEQLSIKEVKKLDLKSFEHFPYKIMIGSLFLGWCAFDIDEIEKQIYTEQIMPSKLHTSWALSEDIYLSKKILYPTDKVIYYASTDYFTFSYIPLIIFSPTFKYFYKRVIDGNHRLSYALKNNIQILSSYFLTEHFFLFHNTAFFDSFSRSIFLFWCDLHFFLQSYHHRKKLKNRIFQMSDNRHFLNNSNIFLS